MSTTRFRWNPARHHRLLVTGPDEDRRHILDRIISDAAGVGCQVIQITTPAHQVLEPAAVDAIRSTIDDLAETTRRRYTQTDFDPLLLVIDDATSVLLALPRDAKKGLTSVVHVGRAVQIYIVMGSRRDPGLIAMDRQIRDNFTSWIDAVDPESDPSIPPLF